MWYDNLFKELENNKNELQNQIGKVYEELIDQKKTVSYEP